MIPENPLSNWHILLATIVTFFAAVVVQDNDIGAITYPSILPAVNMPEKFDWPTISSILMITPDSAYIFFGFVLTTWLYPTLFSNPFEAAVASGNEFSMLLMMLESVMFIFSIILLTFNGRLLSKIFRLFSRPRNTGKNA